MEIPCTKRVCLNISEQVGVLSSSGCHPKIKVLCPLIFYAADLFVYLHHQRHWNCFQELCYEAVSEDCCLKALKEESPVGLWQPGKLVAIKHLNCLDSNPGPSSLTLKESHQESSLRVLSHVFLTNRIEAPAVEKCSPFPVQFCSVGCHMNPCSFPGKVGLEDDSPLTQR